MYSIEKCSFCTDMKQKCRKIHSFNYKLIITKYQRITLIMNAIYIKLAFLRSEGVRVIITMIILPPPLFSY